MELAARRYARKVLLAHLGLLLLVLLVTAAAVRYLYLGARSQAREQAKQTQVLLSNQTAAGIQNYYESVTSVLNLLQPMDNASTAPMPRPVRPKQMPTTEREAHRKMLEAGPLGRMLSFDRSIWHSIQDKCSMLFVVDPMDQMSVVRVIGSTDSSLDAGAITKEAQHWLAGITAKSVSPYMKLGPKQEGAHLVCVPIRGPGGLLMVAVVPVHMVELTLLEPINRSASTGTMLVDDSGTIVSSSIVAAVGHHYSELRDRRSRALAEKYFRTGVPGTEFFENAEMLGDVQLHPAMSSIDPIDVLDRRWFLAVSQGLDEIDDLVKPIFQNAMLWAGFVMLATTGILVSTAVQMIRSRVRLERAQMEMINKELSQARQIQLSWLPDQPCAMNLVDLAAVNTPASHVSGDFYNWFELPDGRVVVTIGDVTGHGMAAAFLMATTQLLVRTTMPRIGEPGQCMEEVNRQLCTMVFSGQFVTMLILVLDLERNEVEIATAGHPPPLVGEGGAFRELAVDPQLVLGVEEDLEVPTQRFPIKPGSTLLLYTDGVSEAVSSTGQRFNTEGLLNSLHGKFDSAKAVVQTVLDAVAEFRAGRDLADDLTVVAIQLQPAPAVAEQLVGAK
jgi:serine phosphatase RsbU (regulator of sigma subunit)